MDTSNAKAYSTLNKPQYEIGCDFIRLLNLSKGDKVLDMGCGTGEVTKFIADVVGQGGEVVGVDPDVARIKVAQEKFRDMQNVKFFVGNSANGFPRDNEPYFDVHFSNGVFHWVLGEEKKAYLKKAYQCLKPGGRIAIRTADYSKLFRNLPMESLSVEELEELFQDVGLFTAVVIEPAKQSFHFVSMDEAHAWFKASTGRDIEDMDPEFIKRFYKAEGNRTITMKLKELICITARK